MLDMHYYKKGHSYPGKNVQKKNMFCVKCIQALYTPEYKKKPESEMTVKILFLEGTGKGGISDAMPSVSFSFFNNILRKEKMFGKIYFV